MKESRDSIADIWGPRNGFKGEGQWSERVDYALLEEPDKWVQSACVLCSNGCAMDIGVKDNKIVGVRGRAVDRVNKGRLGPKGMNTFNVNHSSDRLTHPMIRKKGKLEKVSWDEAMSLVVSRTKEIQKELSGHGIGFYTSGQLFLEEYYTLAVIGKGGLGTLHMDGNTRLCTATAAASMRENFGIDGQPGSYTDIDVTDCIFLVGHNMSATQTVLWSRILDRLDGPDPPKIIVMDPRRSNCAKKADVHIAPRIGTNLVVLNGIQRLLFEKNYINEAYVNEHTIGVEQLRKTVAEYTPEVVERISGVPPEVLQKAAEVLGNTKSLLSTALQGVYQSNQATASACAVNNINILLGKLGSPGSGIFQMNGQPTAQNNREAGCDGEYPGFRNQQNLKHMQELADHWNIDINQLPHWGLPTPIMQMLSFIEAESMKMFYVSGTNPLVSLPNLGRTRKALTKDSLFLVVQDIFLTETAQLADVVLPAAMWGEKTGCFTNVDRTVHISHKAVDPPGEARSDLEIWIDFATRMGFKGKDGKPLVHWKTSEEAFKAWSRTTKGRLCDYTGITYEKLTGGSGIQWPCNSKNPNGTERLYTDAKFLTTEEDCESYGHDLETGAQYTKEQYRLMNPAGRAILKSCKYREPEEAPNDEYPFSLSTGRRVYHFHTRTKTGRSKRLQDAAPDPFVQISEADASRLNIAEGDLVVVSSRRGKIEVPAKVGDIEDGQTFIPFHYGYFDVQDGSYARAANELTMTSWDFVSKQPIFKTGAVALQKANEVHIHEKQSEAAHKLQSPKEPHPQRRTQHLQDFLGLFLADVDELNDLYGGLIERFANYADVRQTLKILKDISKENHQRVEPFARKYGASRHDAEANSRLVRQALFPKARQQDAFDLMMDLQGLMVYLTHEESILMSLGIAAAALHDGEFVEAVTTSTTGVGRQKSWVQTQIKMRSSQTLVVPSLKSGGEL